MLMMRLTDGEGRVALSASHLTVAVMCVMRRALVKTCTEVSTMENGHDPSLLVVSVGCELLSSSSLKPEEQAGDMMMSRIAVRSWNSFMGWMVVGTGCSGLSYFLKVRKMSESGKRGDVKG